MKKRKYNITYKNIAKRRIFELYKLAIENIDNIDLARKIYIYIMEDKK